MRIAKLKGPRTAMSTRMLALRLFVLVFTCAQFSFGQMTKETASGTEEKRVLNVNRLFNEAGIRNDIDTLDRLMAANYRTLGIHGEVTGTKQSFLSLMKAGRMTFTFHKDRTLRVKIKGTTAVVTGESTTRGTVEGRPFNLRYRFSDVYEKHDGQWQIVLSRLTAIILQ